MVVPALLIVALDAGLRAAGPRSLPLVVGARRSLGVGARPPRPHRAPASRVRRRRSLVAVLGVGLPYGVAFKLGDRLGPRRPAGVPATSLGRLADLPFPGPPLLAVGAAVVPVRPRADRRTAPATSSAATSRRRWPASSRFSISLAFLRALPRRSCSGACDRRLPRDLPPCCSRLTALCHLIPAIFAVVATVVRAARRRGRSTGRGCGGSCRSARWPLAARRVLGRCRSAAARLPERHGLGEDARPASPRCRHDFLGASGSTSAATAQLERASSTTSARRRCWVVALAVVGVVVALVLRIRLGVLLGVCAVGHRGRSSSSRPRAGSGTPGCCPSTYLCLYLLAGIAVAELGRADRPPCVAPTRPDRSIAGRRWSRRRAASLAVLVVVGLPARRAARQPSRDGTDGDRPVARRSSRRRATATSCRDWARWNYTGYEGKAGLPRVPRASSRRWATSAPTRARLRPGHVGVRERQLDRYGTPMAPMLLPYWTDGCIGSMEGLYFEASATTPYHFLNQRRAVDAAARAPSATCPTRRLRHRPRRRSTCSCWACATTWRSPTAVEARPPTPTPTSPRSRTDGPWHVYEVADSDAGRAARQRAGGAHRRRARQVVGRARRDVVRRTRRAGTSYLADDGPTTWQRVAAPATPARATERGAPTSGRLDAARRRREPEVAPADRSRSPTSTTGTDRISLRRRRVGVPVLVKTSYFPNWQASGADGPVPGDAQPDGRRPDRHPRRAALRLHAASTRLGYVADARSASAWSSLFRSPTRRAAPAAGARLDRARPTGRTPTATPDDDGPRRRRRPTAEPTASRRVADRTPATRPTVRPPAAAGSPPSARRSRPSTSGCSSACWPRRPPLGRRRRRRRPLVAAGAVSWALHRAVTFRRRPLRAAGCAEHEAFVAVGRRRRRRRRRASPPALLGRRRRPRPGAGLAAKLPAVAVAGGVALRSLHRRVLFRHRARGPRRPARDRPPPPGDVPPVASSSPPTARTAASATPSARLRAALARSRRRRRSRSSWSTTARRDGTADAAAAAGADQVVVPAGEPGQGRGGAGRGAGRARAAPSPSPTPTSPTRPTSSLGLLERGRGGLGRRRRQPPPRPRPPRWCGPAACARSAAGSSTCSPTPCCSASTATPSAG